MTIDNSTEMGTSAEMSFVNLMRGNGHSLEKASKHSDMYEHWDFLIDGRHKVEVKARKKSKRHDKNPNDTWVYVEFKNVRGDAGWLYGKADYLAFERPDGFLLVPRTSLVELAETLIELDWADRPTPYKSYRRRDRPAEHVGVLLIHDVVTLPHRLIRW